MRVLCFALMSFLLLCEAQINGPNSSFTATVAVQPQNTTATLAYDPVAKLMSINNTAYQTVTNFDWGLQYRSCSPDSCSVEAVNLEMPKFFVDSDSLEFRSPLCGDFAPELCDRIFLNYQISMTTQLTYGPSGELKEALLKSKDGITRMAFTFSAFALGVAPSSFDFGHTCVAHCSIATDTALILDSSESISDPEWETSKLFAQLFGNYSNMSASGMNIGLVVFARDAWTYPMMSNISDYQQVTTTMQRQNTGQTNLGFAILQAKDMLSGARPDAKKVVIFISDGMVSVFCDPDSTDTTQCIAPGSAAQELNATFGDGVDIFGLIVTDFNPASAATFDSITGTSNQFSLYGAEPITWAAIYILDSICNDSPHDGCRDCPYFMCGCDDQCITVGLVDNNTIDTPVPGTMIETTVKVKSNDSLWAVLPVGVLVLGAIAAVLIAIFRRKKQGGMAPALAAEVPPIEPVGMVQNVPW